MVKQVFLLLLALVTGSIANMGVLSLIGWWIPSPIPADATPEVMAGLMKNFEWYHFPGPWLAHASGTFVGALVVRKWSAFPRAFPLVVAGFFFLGGLAMVLMLPGTPWLFILVDLLLAYFPIAGLSIWLVPSVSPKSSF